MILHTVNKAPPGSDCLESCLEVAAEEDVLLLIEDGVYALLPGSAGERLLSGHARLRVLQSDLRARGLALSSASHARMVDMDRFVALAAEAEQIVNWF